MFPRLSCNDLPNSCAINSVLVGYVLDPHSAVRDSFPDSEHGRFIKFGIPVLGSNLQIVSALTNGVTNVVAHSSFPKMIGITARRVIALVAYYFGCVEMSEGKEKGYSVSTQVSAKKIDATVTSSESNSRPRPTFVWSTLFDFRPETLLLSFNTSPSPFSRRPSFLRASGFCFSSSRFSSFFTEYCRSLLEFVHARSIRNRLRIAR